MRGRWGKFILQVSWMTVGSMMVTLGVAITTSNVRDLPEWASGAGGLALAAWGMGMIVRAAVDLSYDVREQRTQAWAAQ